MCYWKHNPIGIKACKCCLIPLTLCMSTINIFHTSYDDRMEEVFPFNSDALKAKRNESNCKRRNEGSLFAECWQSAVGSHLES